MKYYKIMNGEYIDCVGKGAHNSGVEITEVEYKQILQAIAARPAPTVKVGHRLRTDLSYESFDLPEITEDEEATIEDYQAALAELGVSV